MQLYGKDSKGTDLKGRWRAKCLEKMMKEHTEWMKVAYLDEDKETKHQYSVLIKYHPGKGKVVELYRSAPIRQHNKLHLRH